MHPISLRKQIHAYFSGAVQGVGFRFTCCNIAKELGISGWVKNLADGRVEVLAEAEERVLKEFLNRINHFFSRYIENTDIRWQEGTSGIQGFIIKF